MKEINKARKIMKKIERKRKKEIERNKQIQNER